MEEQPTAGEYPPLYLQGIELFNDCEYFEAHDVWEELWADYQGPLRHFYQGLIQAAVCLHHFGNGNTRGARKLLNSSTKYLEQYCPMQEGLDLDKFLAEMQTCCAEIVASEEEYPKVEIVPDLLPEIHLQ
jgi:predicted metal-dependent hydrolase